MTSQPLEQLFGRLISVDRRSLGSALSQAASISDTVLHVDSVDDFGEDGGQVYIGGVLYDYDLVDEDALTITLGTPGGLQAAADVDDLVELYDPEVDGITVEYVGLVLLDDQDPGDEPIEVSVQHSLVDLLQEAIRGGAAESVALIRDGEDDWTVWQVDGKLAINEAVKKVQDDVDVVDETLGELAEDLTELNEVTLPGLQADLATLDGMFPITATNISDGAISTPKLAANSVTADKIIANAVGADKIAANSIGADKIIANSIGADKLAANSVTADKIAANAVTADKISAGAITAGKLAADAINGRVITGGEFHTGSNTTGNGVHLTSSHNIAVNPSGTGNVFATQGTSSPVYISSVGLLVDGEVSAATLQTTSPPTSGAGDGSAVRLGTSGRINKVTSSRRYKTDETPLTVDVAAVLALTPKRYTRIETGRSEVGFVAEDAEDLGLDPWVIREDGRVESFAYESFAAVAHQAVLQHQAAQIAAQAEQIAALTARLDALEGA